jgi:hypothetical protein
LVGETDLLNILKGCLSPGNEDALAIYVPLPYEAVVIGVEFIVIPGKGGYSTEVSTTTGKEV